MEWRLINSRFPGKCAVCGGEIEAGAEIYWKRRQAVHVACMNGQKPAEGPQNQPTAQDKPEPRGERARPLGNIRYVASGEPEPDAAEWEYRKTSKKGNRSTCGGRSLLKWFGGSRLRFWARSRDRKSVV